MFTRHHNDIVCQVPISFHPGPRLGSALEVPTLRRPRDARNPARAPKHGEVFFKLKGKGVPDLPLLQKWRLRSSKILIEIPKKLSDRQKEGSCLGNLPASGGTRKFCHKRKSFMDKL